MPNVPRFREVVEMSPKRKRDKSESEWVQRVSYEEVSPMPLRRSKPTLALCKATTSSGARCKAKPHKDGLCSFHSDPKKAAELGRKGGRRNRHTYQTPWQHEAMADIRSGKMDPKLGAHSAISGCCCSGPLRLQSLQRL